MLAEIHWNAATLSIALGCAIPIVAIIGMFWFKSVKVTSENDLKRRMVERGMSPEEIERVLHARSDRDNHKA